MGLPPVDDQMDIHQLVNNPYPAYARYRQETPIVKVASIRRVLMTKAADLAFAREHPEIFSSNDPSAPMKRAFEAHTLMRKDGEEHRRERMAMAATFTPKLVRDVWSPIYATHAAAYLDRLPQDEVIDLFPTLAGPLAATF